ncbi:MAG: CYTH domain-containing protein [Clostridiales bacterium]|nr:CYTH domain-containing protein [Candidatus Crickella merdequi]
METEFKYRVTDASVFDQIIQDPILENHLKNDRAEDIKMHAVYFDTENHDLRKAGIAYRIRYENDRIVATIKWDNMVKDGLHSREEFNLVINDERFAEEPDIEIFKSSDAYDVLYAAVGDKKLTKLIEMEFDRKLAKVDTGRSISAISIDDGVIHRRDGDIGILELEIEWYYGDEDDFKELALRIADKYSLEPENASKLQRGFA